MLDPEIITQQRTLLTTYRRTLAHLLAQAAQFGGEVFAPPQTANGIAMARAEIRRIKVTLREGGVAVEDDPNEIVVSQDEPIQSQRALGETISGDKIDGDKVVGGDKISIAYVMGTNTASDPEVRVTTTNYYQVPVTPLDRQQQRNRRAMLAKVKSIWIEGLLEQSLTKELRIALDLTEQPDAVDLPLNMLVQELKRLPRPFPAGTPMIKVFEQMGGALLILGAPGAGKTTLLLELARDLIARAEQDEAYPIPVVFNLSSWVEKRRPLKEWLVEELHTKYDVPRKLAQEWMDVDVVLPLLDGLDEVAEAQRTACVVAINAYRQDQHGLMPIAVCSRRSDYEILDARLRLSGAVVVLPLALEQIDMYLGRTNTDLAGVRTAMQVDIILQELVKTPLMLYIITLAYRGTSGETLPAFESPEHWRKQLFTIYVDRMFARRGIATDSTRAQMLHWLSWLARTMRQHGQTIFFIERLQPQWLPRLVQRRQYALGVGLVVGIIFGLLVGLSWGLFLKLIIREPEAWIFGSTDGLIAGLVFGLNCGLTVNSEESRIVSRQHIWYAIRSAIGIGVPIGLVVGLASGGSFQLSYGLVVYGLYGGMIGLAAVLLTGLVPNPSKIESVEILRWSWPKAKMRLANVLVVGFIVGLAAGLVQGLPNGLISGVANGLTLGLIAVLIFGLGTGLTAGELDTKMSPNQGMRRSARNMIQIGGAMGLVACLPSILIMGIVSGLGYGFAHLESFLILGLGYGLVYGLLVGLVSGLVYGGLACVEHVVLRFILYQKNYLPWNLAPFLDYAAERIFLRKVGGGYIFVHRLLMEHFASREPETAE